MTTFGGTLSDRGWGVAASPQELYLCGATASSALFDQFPVVEWNADPNDPASLLDWFEAGFPAGISSELVPWYTFFQAMDYDVFGIDQFIEGMTPHDGFIASFGLDPAAHAPTGGGANCTNLRCSPIPGVGHALELPTEGSWDVEAYSADGRLVAQHRIQGRRGLLPSVAWPPGRYLIQAASGANRLAARIHQP